MANKIEILSRVTAWPVHSRFPYPKSPFFSTTDFLSDVVESSQADNRANEDVFGRPNPNKTWEVNNIHECMTNNRVRIPFNNKIESEAIDDEVWYNSDLPFLRWYDPAISDGLASPRIFAPWITDSYSTEPARALNYRYKTVAPETPNQRVDYSPADSTWQFEPVFSETYKHGFTFVPGISLDPNTETWAAEVVDGETYWTKTITPAALSADRPYWQLFVQTGDRDSTTKKNLYIFKFPYEGDPIVYRCLPEDEYSPSRWEVVTHWKLGGGGTDQQNSSDAGYKGYYGWNGTNGGKNSLMEVTYIAGRMTVTYGGGTPLVLEVVSDVKKIPVGDELITGIKFDGMGAKSLTFAIQPHQWRAATWRYVSRRITVGFVPDREAAVTFTLEPAFLWDVLPPAQNFPYDLSLFEFEFDEELLYGSGELQYQVTYTGDLDQTDTYGDMLFGNDCMPLKSVTVKIAEVLSDPVGVPVVLYPERILVDQNFDFGDLSITSNATLIFNNFKDLQAIYGGDTPAVYWGEFSNYTGAIAVEIDLGVSIRSASALLYESGWTRVFTGYGNLQSTTVLGSGGNDNRYIMQCHDRSVSMQNELFNLPWFDGWNIYYVAAHMAGRGGFKQGTPGDTDLAFREYVPETPQGDVGNPYPGEDTYFLPLGTGGNPLQRYPGGARPWDVLGKIGRLAGYIRYVNVYGKFDFRKWKYLNVAIPERIFSIVDGQSLPGGSTNPRLATEVFAASVTRNLFDVRNQVVLMGYPVTGGWAENATVVSVVDNDSIYPPAGALTIFDETAGNYLGFLRTNVWVDNLFAIHKPAENPEKFAKLVSAAEEILAVMSKPSLTLQVETWCQPDMYPEARIGFLDRRTGAFDLPSGKFFEYMVTKVSHDIKKGMGKTTLQARYLPPFNF